MLTRLLRIIGNSLLHGSIFILIIGGIIYITVGAKIIPNLGIYDKNILLPSTNSGDNISKIRQSCCNENDRSVDHSGITNMSGEIITGLLRWSDEYSGQKYEQAWNTCVELNPVGHWRLPSQNEVETGRHIDSGLFTGNKNYWTSSSNITANTESFLAWNPGSIYWNYCYAAYTSVCYGYGGISNNDSVVFRCVSNL